MQKEKDLFMLENILFRYTNFGFLFDFTRLRHKPYTIMQP